MEGQDSRRAGGHAQELAGLPTLAGEAAGVKLMIVQP